MITSRGTLRGTLLLLAVMLLLPCRATLADFASAPVSGAAVVTTGHFTNIYFFPRPSQQTWEQHLTALHTANPQIDLTETRAAIDNFVLNLTHTTYFNRLSQYAAGIAGSSGPINPPLFLGEQQTVQACVDAALKTVTNNIVGFDTLRNLAGCQNGQGKKPSDQVNIILSPEFDAANIFQTQGICGGETAFHASFPGTPNFTVIPTNPKCNPSFANVAESISHEMVETLSDPAGFGYIHESQPARFLPDPTKGFADDINSEFSNGELADICQKGGIKNPNQDPNIWAITLLGVPVARYWSNIDSNCEPQPGLMISSQTPVLTQPVNRLQIDILTGGDDLRSDSTATASVVVNGSSVLFQLKAGSDHSWDNNSEHVKTFTLPATVPLSALGNLTISLQSHNNSTETNDNWNVQTVSMTPMLAAANPTKGFPDIIKYATCFAHVSGNPFVRLTGNMPSMVVAPFAGCVAKLPPTTPVNQASFVIVTGGDDLRGDSSATLVIPVNGQPRSFTLKSDNEAGWGNNTTHTKTFSFGTLQPVSSIGPITITLQSHVHFPETGDNWNIQSVVANLSDAGRSTTCYANVSGNPFSRLTGDKPSVTIPARQGC